MLARLLNVSPNITITDGSTFRLSDVSYSGLFHRYPYPLGDSWLCLIFVIDHPLV